MEALLPGFRPLAAYRPFALPAEVRPWTDATRVLLALFAVTLLCYAVDERTLLGVSVWSKPLKFQASLALHLATLALLYCWLEPRLRRSRWLRFAIAASAAAALGEIFWIMLQAGRGRASHFNDATALESGMYALMGLGSLLLVLAPAVLGVLLLRDRARRGGVVRLAAGVGLVSSAAATLAVAGFLSSGSGHWIGEPSAAAAAWPLVGWSREVGDLRVAHFFATHAMQVLPLAVLALPAGWRRDGIVYALAAGYLLLIGLVFAQALQGRPFLLPGMA